MTGGAYAPYAPCLSTPLVRAYRPITGRRQPDLSGDVTDDAFFRLDADDPCLNEVIHDAALWVNVSNELSIVANNLRPDVVVRLCTCSNHTTNHNPATASDSV